MKTQIKYIGNYKIVDVLGTGGMAKVYTAMHTSLKRLVVIKEMARTESRQRFKQEAVISAALKHKNIVTTHDYFTIGSSCYLVMEYVDGVDLAAVIQQTAPLPPRVAALIARDVCSALTYAHTQNIIHRDIKPTNVLISRRGGVKISDFGVARGETLPHLTQTGTVIGTPFYMSPEQASGDDVTSQTDIYSLGIVLYEMVTGKKPFTGKNAHAITSKVCRGKYPSVFWNMPQHSLRLARIIEQAMQKNLKRRYVSAKLFSQDLEKFIGKKAIASRQKNITHLVQGVTKSKQVTTVIKRTRKRKHKRKKKAKTSVYLYIIAIITLIALVYYLITLLFA